MKFISSLTTNRFTLLYAALVILILGSCAKNEIIEETPKITIPESQELVHTTLYGRIIDESGIPVEGAQISYLSGLNPGQTMSDIDGYFKFLDVDNKGRAAFFSVQSTGKFEAFRKFSVLPERFNYTEVKLLERKIIGTIDSESGGKVTSNQKASVELPKGGIVDGLGRKYTGNVNVALAWIDPSAGDLSQRMVGDLSGIDEDGNYRSLSSFGMLQVELIDDSGNLLNIDKDEDAVLEFPIPQSMLNDATPAIPLWSYDEVVGTWVQEGFAILDGDSYVGNVGHFSSWNVDHMTDPIEIKGQVKWKVGDGKVGGSYFQVYVCSENIGRKGGWLCDDGSFRFYNFPKDEKFKLKIFDKCEDEIFRETYGPFSEDTDLGVIEVAANENVIKVFGNAINCDGAPVTKGQVNVIQHKRVTTFPIYENGEFEFSVDVCGDGEALIQVIDLESVLANEIEIDPVNNILELNDIKVCDELKQFISFKIGDEPLVVLPSLFYIFDDSSLDSTSVQETVSLFYEREANTTEDVKLLAMIFPYKEGAPVTVDAIELFFSIGEYQYSSHELVLQVTLTKNSRKVGDDIEGSFTGSVSLCRNPSIEGCIGPEEVVPITGNFRTQVQ